MTRDEIRKAMEWELFNYPQIEIAITRIEKVAAEAVKQEREACAQVCEIVGEDGAGAAGEVWSDRCAAAIRARGQQ